MPQSFSIASRINAIPRFHVLPDLFDSFENTWLAKWTFPLNMWNMYNRLPSQRITNLYEGRNGIWNCRLVRFCIVVRKLKLKTWQKFQCELSPEAIHPLDKDKNSASKQWISSSEFVRGSRTIENFWNEVCSRTSSIKWVSMTCLIWIAINYFFG